MCERGGGGWLEGVGGGWWLANWLDLLNAELSPKRYWQGPRTQEVGKEGDYTYRYTITTRITLAFRWAAMRAVLIFH